MMMISSRGRYALRVMTDLCEYGGEQFTPLKEIAGRQNISLKYLEGIMTTLSKSGFVEGAHGKGGGYRLNRLPEEYRIGDILRLTEGTLSPVGCPECGSGQCDRAAQCRTLPMWTKLDRMINEYFDGITLANLTESQAQGDYEI